MADQPNITGPWTTDDNTAHHIEAAQTDMTVPGGNEHLVALRNTADPGNCIFVTPGEARTFGQSVQQPDSRTARLLGSARK